MTAKFHSLKISLLMSGVLLALRPASAQCVPPPSGLVAWWPGDGNALDIVAGHDGYYTNGVSFVSGTVGQAFNFVNANAAVMLTNTSNLRLQNFTIECWIKRGSTNVVNPGPQTYDADIFGFGANGFSFAMQTDGHLFLTKVNVSNITGTPVVRDLNWHHVAVTTTGGNVVFYVDGVAYPAGFYAPTYQFTTPAAVGAAGDYRDHTFWGAIDEVSVYNRALSSTEIASIYAAGSDGKCRTPFITSQPQSQLAYWGQSVSFSVGALPPPLSYQWQSNGVAISGATNQTLTLTNLQNSFAAGYSVVVANSYGSVTSAPPANLTINPAGVAIALYPGVKIDGVVGFTYGIQSTTNLSNPNSWIGRTNLTLAVTPVIWSDYQPSPAQTFYRVLQGPIPIP